MNQIIRLFMPLFISMAVNTGCAYMVQAFFPQVYEISAALAAVCALPTIAVMSCIWKKDRRLEEKSKRGCNRSKREIQVLLWKVLLLCLGGALCSVLMAECMEAAGFYRLFSNTTQEGLFASPVWLQILGSGLLAPISEELTYRGVFYGRARKLLPVSAAIVLTSFLFAAAHGNWIQFFYALPMGILLCLSYEWTDSLCGPIAFHMGANLISIMLTM